MAADFSVQAKDFDQDFIRVSSHALNASVVEESHGWVRALSQAMRELDTATLGALRDRIASRDTALHREPATLEELKQVRGNACPLWGGWAGRDPHFLKSAPVRVEHDWVSCHGSRHQFISYCNICPRQLPGTDTDQQPTSLGQTVLSRTNVWERGTVT